MIIIQQTRDEPITKIEKLNILQDAPLDIIYLIIRLTALKYLEQKF